MVWITNGEETQPIIHIFISSLFFLTKWLVEVILFLWHRLIWADVRHFEKCKKVNFKFVEFLKECLRVWEWERECAAFSAALFVQEIFFSDSLFHLLSKGTSSSKKCQEVLKLNYFVFNYWLAWPYLKVLTITKTNS